MKVLNLHGFDGSSNNTNYKILKSLDVDVVSPQLDYRSMTIQEVSDILFPLMREEKANVIVATSYGSFFGKRLADRFGVPCIFTNPCFRPDISLKDLVPEYCTPSRRREFRDWIEDQKFYDFAKDSVIIGEQDEFINHKDITLFEAEGAEFHYIPDGKHHLERYQYEDILKSILEELQYS